MQGTYKPDLLEDKIFTRTKPNGTCKRRLVNPNPFLKEGIDKRRKSIWRISTLLAHGITSVVRMMSECITAGEMPRKGSGRGDFLGEGSPTA